MPVVPFALELTWTPGMLTEPVPYCVRCRRMLMLLSATMWPISMPNGPFGLIDGSTRPAFRIKVCMSRLMSWLAEAENAIVPPSQITRSTFRYGKPAEPMLPFDAVMFRMLLRIRDTVRSLVPARMSPAALETSVSPIGLSTLPLNTMSVGVVFVLSTVTRVGVITCAMRKNMPLVTPLAPGVCSETVFFAVELMTWISCRFRTLVESFSMYTDW